MDVEGFDSFGEDVFEVDRVVGKESTDCLGFVSANVGLVVLRHGTVFLGWNTGETVKEGLVGSDKLFVVGAHIFNFDLIIYKK